LNAVGKSKVLKLAFVLTIFILVAPGFVAAHAPSSVDLSYNEATDELSVTVTHTGVDGTTHRISEIQVYKNDVLQTSETYSSQTTTSSHSDTFIVAAEPGDVLRVVAICSISGQREGTLTVGGTTTDTTTDTNGLGRPLSYLELTLLIGVAVVVIVISVVIVRVVRRR
jgi:hypothetical protein